MRLFVAILLEPSLLEEVERLQARLRQMDGRGDVRWVDPAGIHLTLKFLGEVDAARVAGLQEALEAGLAGHEAPRLDIAGLGAFPNPRRPRVFWVGLREEGDRLAGIHARVEEACAARGWEREGRSFQPHLTVGRVRERAQGRSLPQGLLRALEEGAPGVAKIFRPHPWVALIRSHLSPRGARYETVSRWRLSTATGE